MTNEKKAFTILVADDDADDQMLIKDAFAEIKFDAELNFVDDGEQLLAYLRREGRFEHLKDHQLPSLVLLDLNMPKKDGREALQEIKADPSLSSIPIVVLTTSSADEDILSTYSHGVSSFITKPVSFEKLVAVVDVFVQYWLQTVELPSNCGSVH